MLLVTEEFLYLHTFQLMKNQIIKNLSKIKLLPALFVHISSSNTTTDLLWHTIYFNPRKSFHTWPLWTGYILEVTVGDFPDKTVVSMLSIINVNPGDMSCTFSTFTFIINQVKELHITMQVLTFDKYEKNMSIVLILRGFHTMMSHCASMGTLMEAFPL